MNSFIPHRICRSVARALQTVPLSAMVLALALAAPLVLPANSEAATPDNRITFNGKKYYLNGINVAWNSWSDDFNNYKADKFKDMFKTIKASGGNFVRMWIHCDGVSSPNFDGSGKVTGVSSQFLDNMKTFLDDAHADGILVMYVLWSFEIHEKRPKLVKDSEVHKSYIDKVLNPMVDKVGKHPALISWEIINEPEWMDETTTWPEIQKFCGVFTAAIRKRSPDSKTLITVGNGYTKHLTGEGAPEKKNYFSDAELKAKTGDPLAYLDFYQTHYYSWMHKPEHGWTYSPWEKSPAEMKLDKPIFIGEFPAKGQSGYLSSMEMHTKAVDMGYAGTASWAYFDNRYDKAGYWPDAEPGIEAINAKIPNAIKGEGSVTSVMMGESLHLAPDVNILPVGQSFGVDGRILSQNRPAFRIEIGNAGTHVQETR